MDLPHSDACFVQAYPAETAEAFCDGHNGAFAFFGKVPRSILYDNTTLAVARILGDGVRQRTRVFSKLQSHYLFADRFGRPGKGNDKGKVEGLIGWIRRNLLVPVPRAASLTALNEQLLEGCRRRLGDRLRGHDERIGERLVPDLAAFHALPPAPYDACEKKASARITQGAPLQGWVAGKIFSLMSLRTVASLNLRNPAASSSVTSPRSARSPSR
jgi:hypothetical protein